MPFIHYCKLLSCYHLWSCSWRRDGLQQEGQQGFAGSQWQHHWRAAAQCSAHGGAAARAGYAARAR